MSKLRTLVLVLVLLLLPLPIQAHWIGQMEDWYSDWRIRYSTELVAWASSGDWEKPGILLDLVYEYQDMMLEHPKWVWEPAPYPSTFYIPKAPRLLDQAEIDRLVKDEADYHARVAAELEAKQKAEAEARARAEAEAAEKARQEQAAREAGPPVSGGVENWRPLVSLYFSPGDVNTALCLMGFESAGNPNATNPSSGAAGLFQFIPSTWSNMIPSSIKNGNSVYDPETNVKAAAWLKDAAGWTQWAPYIRGECR